MVNFIKKLEEFLDIQIIYSDKFIPGTDTFSVDKTNNIKSLYLYYVELKNLNILLPIASSLTKLCIRDSGIQNLSALKHFHKLEILDLNSNPLLPSSFENIKQLEQLKYLDLSGTDLQDTIILAELRKLEFLYIGYNSDIEEVNYLENLNYLKHLGLEFTGIKRVKDIAINNTIQTLNLKGSEIEDMTGLSHFTNLIELNLSGNPIRKIEGLSDLKQLKKLNLSSINIDSIEGLESLTSLDVLDLSNNELQEITGIDALVELRELNLSENEIIIVENLDGLSNLEYLLLDCNKIHELDSNFLFNIKHPCFISLCYNHITKINKNIPSNINIKFTTSNYMPRVLF